MYISAIAGGLFINAPIPLYYEICVEALFPIGEGLIAGM